MSDMIARAQEAGCGALLLTVDLAVPGTRFDPDLVLDALGRLARAVGAHEEHYAALLRLSR